MWVIPFQAIQFLPRFPKCLFRHNGVVLHHFTTDAIGDLLSVNSDGTYALTYPMPQKDGFGGTARRLVALVHKVNQSNLRENYVLNAAQISLTPTGILLPHQQSADAAVRDLTGRRILHPRRGIYIREGRKLLIH